MGSLSSMAPEQARGEPVDHRADLFALGTLLFELLSGERPFRRGTALATLHAICEAEPPALEALAPDLPPDLVELVGEMLEKDPERRIGEAAEVARRLRRILRTLDATVPEAASGPPAPRGRRRWAAALALLLATAVAAGALLRRDPPPPPPSTDERFLAVLPFQILQPEGPPRDVAALAGLRSSLIAKLEGIGGVVVFSLAKTRDYRSFAADSEKILADLENLDFAVEGSISWPQERDSLEIEVWLTDAAGGEVISRETFPADREDFRGLGGALALFVVDSIGHEVTAQERRRLAERNTENERASRLYLEGLGLDSRAGYSTTDSAEAIRTYERAIEADPQFLEARFRLIRRE
ncbi:MAG: hypothetical protein AAF725_28075, partial [Acidobacteriota bacterium]